MSRVKTILVAVILVVGILFPTTALASPEATVSITDATLPTGASGSVALTISGVSADRPVSCITVDVNYEPSVVEVLDVSGGGFSSLVDNIQNPDGYTRLVAYVTSETGLTGTIKVADITLTRLGGESELALDVITLKDDDGQSIPFTVDNGWVTADGTPPADDTPPTVISTSPANGATGVAITTTVRATFSEAIDEGTLSFSLDGVDGSVSYSGTTATFTPSANLGYSTSYTASISASDLAGNPMVAPYSCTFTTGTVPTVPPVVTTDPATGVTTTLATLNGSLTDLGTATAVGVSFEWGETSAYGNETTTQTMTSTDAFSSSLSGLSPNTTYHFRAKAVGDGTSYGIDSTFTTGTVPTVPPALTTDPATGVTTTTLATLNGSLTDLGTATSVSVSFEWGTTTAYGNETTPQTMTSTGSFSFSLSGLSSGTTYHFRAKAVGDGTSYGIDRTFTTRARGGGGGGAPSPAAPPAPPPGTTDVRGQVSDAGVFLESVTATSEDRLCTLTIPEGTVGLTEELEPLTEISTLLMDEPPPPPEATHVIALAYDLGPDGATFDPPITLTLSYDPDDIPEGIAEEDLAIAYYDQATGEWVELEDCVVDIESNTITASVSHFTTFTIIGVVTPPPEVAPPEEEEIAPPKEEEIAPPAPPIEPEEVEEVPAPERNWPLIIGIIAAVVVVIGLGAFFLVRRRA